MLYRRGQATLHLDVSVGMSVRPSITFLNSERFLYYCSCPTVRVWIAVYPTLFISSDDRNGNGLKHVELVGPLSSNIAGLNCSTAAMR